MKSTFQVSPGIYTRPVQLLKCPSVAHWDEARLWPGRAGTHAAPSAPALPRRSPALLMASTTPLCPSPPAPASVTAPTREFFQIQSARVINLADYCTFYSVVALPLPQRGRVFQSSCT